MNSKNLTIITLIIVILIGVGAFIISGNNSNNDNTTDASQQPTTTTTTTNQADTNSLPDNPQPISEDSFTLAQVSEHNSSDDCWTIIDGVVYDITSYVGVHPGGNNILSACGTDGTAFFNGEQSGQLGGRNEHSSNARAQLERLRIGTLSE